jgi:hypothetical protein
MTDLRPADLVVGDFLVAELGENPEQLRQDERRLARGARGLHLEHRAVAEGVDRGVHGVGEPFALDHVELQPRREPVVEDPADEHPGAEVGVILGGSEEREAQLGLGFAVVPRHEAPASQLVYERRVVELLSRREPSEPLLSEPEHFLVRERTRRAEDHVARAGGAGVVRAQVVLAQPRDRLPGPADLLPERVVAEERPLGEIVDVDVPPLLVDLVEDLLQDHLALELDLLEERPREHVAEHEEGHLQPLGMDRRVVVAVIAGGDAVQVAADVLDHRIEQPSVGIADASAEEEVLEEMGDAVLPRLLVARAGPDVGGEHPGVQVTQLDGDDSQAVREHALVDGIVQVHLAVGSAAASAPATLIRCLRLPPPGMTPGRGARPERAEAVG